MNAMNLPGFTAEVSLYKTRAQYRKNTSKLVRAEANIFPQLRIVATGPGKIGSLCAQVGDLVDEAYHESIDPRNSQDDRQAWGALANEFIGRSSSDMGCSFGVVR
jgi:hypothetical protein